MLDVVASDQHDTSTWYSALTAAGSIPVASMIWFEGQTFTRFGTHGLLCTDAAANLVIFTIVALVFATHGLGLRTLPASRPKPNVSTS